jgi:predicted  nucleic acid-binding Zn-ribbon protein
MAAITKDHYAINERLDGISVYDIKAILAGQERLQMLESDIEAIKDIINPHREKISYLESIVHTAKVHDNFSGRPIWDVASLTSAVGDLRKDFLRLERDLTVISQSNLSVNDRTCKLESSITSIETTFDDFGRRFNDLWALSNYRKEWELKVERYMEAAKEVRQSQENLIGDMVDRVKGVESTLADQVEYHFKIALAEHLEKVNGFSHSIALAQSNLRNSHEMLAATVETLRIQRFGLADNFFQTVGKIDADVILVKNELDAIRPRIAGLEKAQISDADWQVLQRAHESIDVDIKQIKASHDSFVDDVVSEMEALRSKVAETANSLEDHKSMTLGAAENLDNRVVDLENGANPFNPDTLIDSLESDRQEETADPVGYLERLKKKPNTDYTHDIIP